MSYVCRQRSKVFSFFLKRPRRMSLHTPGMDGVQRSHYGELEDAAVGPRSFAWTWRRIAGHRSG